MKVTDLAQAGGLVEGEIAYDPDNGGIVARLNGVDRKYTTVKTGEVLVGSSNFSLFGTDLKIEAGSTFIMSDGSIRKLAADKTVSLTSVHASTPMQVGWNSLYLRKTATGDTVSVGSPFFCGPDPCGYLGVVRIDAINSGVPFPFPFLRKEGASYYSIRDPWIPALGTTPSDVTLDLPFTASIVRLDVEDEYLSTTSAIEACYGIGYGDQVQCIRSMGEVPVSGSGVPFRIRSTTSSQKTYRIRVLGFDESLSFYR